MPLQLEDKMINLFKKVIPGQVLPEELKAELVEPNDRNKEKDDFNLV